MMTSAALAYRERFLELLFPPACLACRGQLVGKQSARFCVDCLEELAIFRAPFCNGCGKAVPQPLEAGKSCGHCGLNKPRYDRALSLGPYDGLLRNLLLRAKRPAGEVAVRILAQLLAEERCEQLEQSKIDVVCPVPMYWRRRARRLANSAESVAEILAQQLRAPLASRLLSRRRHTKPQSSLPPTGRLENVRRAFDLGAGHHLDGAHVLLVDDILTTGATCNEAARILKRNGASQVTVAVVARSLSSR
ncbi:MAG: ComF family protein [Aeoliella sp.]